MACMSPIQLFKNLKDDKYQLNYDPRCCDLNDFIIVDCGHCPACRKKWRTQLAQRVRYELSNYSYEEKCFITLTCNEDMIDEVFPNRSLNHSYFQRFMKRLRRTLEYHNIKHKKLKYLVSGEYGEINGRPHFHLILFGWKPENLKYRGRSKKGYATYKSKFLEDLWGAGFVDVGDVDEHTAPYMVKYIVKFSEVKQSKKILKEKIDDETGVIDLVEEIEEFCVNGVPVRKPYIVYPKKILGLDYFLKNYKQIFELGYILDSRGCKLAIPKSFLKYAENCDNGDIQDCYYSYKERCEEIIRERNEVLSILAGGYYNIYDYLLEQGRIRREMYTSMKNNNR